MKLLEFLSYAFLWLTTGEAQTFDSFSRELKSYHNSEYKAVKKLSAAIKRKMSGNAKQLAEAAALELNPVLEKVKDDTSVPSEDVSYLRNILLALRGSSSATKYVVKHISEYVDTDLEQDSPIDIHGNPSADLINIVRALTGRNGFDLTTLQKEKYRKEKPELYKQFLDAKKGVVAQVSVFLRNLCRRNGGKILYSQFMKALSSAQVLSHYPPAEGWDGYIDENGVLYTLAGLKIKGKPAFPIRGNKNYDPETNDTYVFSVKTSMGNPQHFYTEDSLKTWRDERFEAVDDFTPIVTKVKKKWEKDVSSPNQRTRYCALICELIYWASARIGSTKNNVRGEKTFGISTLQGQHVYKQGGSLVIDYIGKTGVHQKHILKPVTAYEKKVASAVLKLAKDAGKGNYIFALDATGKPPANSTVNSYFRSKGANVTVHKLRHARATLIMTTLMQDEDESPYVTYFRNKVTRRGNAHPTQREAEDNYKDMAINVGKELGHTSGEKVTPMTAIGNYINPIITTSYFNVLKLRQPSWAKKFAK